MPTVPANRCPPAMPGIAYLLLCAAVGNAHLAQTGVSPAQAGRLGTFCRRALALLTR